MLTHAVWSRMLLGALAAAPPLGAQTVRHYYIAAEQVSWDFTPSGGDLIHANEVPFPWRSQTRFTKERYVEYTDDTFSTPKRQPSWLGILGPIIRAEVGDAIVVHFLNRTTRAHGIHPHGVRYDKASEGALYVPFGAGARVPPGGKFEYHWLADRESGPAPGEQSSVVWWYHSHVDEPEETNAGLLGPIVVTAAGKARADGSPKDVDREFVTLFMIFDQTLAVRQQPPPPELLRPHLRNRVAEQGLFSTINGYGFGNLPGLVMTQGEKVRWYLLGMGNEQDLHTPHWHGKTVRVNQRRTDVVELLPASMVVADMLADNPGTWLFHCQVADHMEGGMMATFIIRHPPRPRPVEFAAGDFWSQQHRLAVRVRNSSGKAIRSMRLHLEYMAPVAQDLRGFPNEWSIGPLAAGDTTTVRFEEYFEQRGLLSYFTEERIIGWVVHPTHIDYADGTSWTPQEHGEGFAVFWRDAAHADSLEVLAPLQPDEELPEDHTPLPR